tara:strand:+ start:43 stop:591 length:549 start_codon:yes stop_codon:yes gene_type:complete
MKVGYIRVSSADQNIERQLKSIECDKVFTDKLSGKDTNRPQLQAMLDFVREGDTIVAQELDRIGRNTEDLLRIVKYLLDKKVSIQFVTENLYFDADNNNAFSELMLSMLSAIAQFERKRSKERQQQGIMIAKKKGKYKGRPRTLSDEQIVEIKTLLKQNVPKTEIAKRLNVTTRTIYRYRDI